jgi:hypothetical protein
LRAVDDNDVETIYKSFVIRRGAFLEKDD